MLSIHDFVRGYAHHRLEEGQGVAGKALQSNIHFQTVSNSKICLIVILGVFFFK